MAVLIGNYRSHRLPRTDTPSFDCTRRSPLGNPFVMQDEKDRNKVCDQYESWFEKQIVEGTNLEFIEQLEHLVKNAKVPGWDIELMCWCAPKRCHCETIKKYIDERINED